MNDNLKELRNEYVKLDEINLKQIAKDSYNLSTKDIKSMNKKSLIDTLLGIEFSNMYKGAY